MSEAPQSEAPAVRWGDLRKRMISAGVMLVIGTAEIWLGGPTFGILVAILTALMIWELARMTAPDATERVNALGLAMLTFLCVCASLLMSSSFALLFVLFPAVGVLLTPRKDSGLAALAGLAIVIAGYGLILIRDQSGITAVLWLVGLVILSDILGYFVGRMLGGPKFWPQISPKKTWSGTIAGWIGAAVWGGLFMVYAGASAWLILISPVVAFAGQMGDIGESWMKRRAGVKDSSNLIPGHGGVMDRFDALTGAVVVVVLLGFLFNLPLPVGH